MDTAKKVRRPRETVNPARKIHRSYTVEEIATWCGAHENRCAWPNPDFKSNRQVASCGINQSIQTRAEISRLDTPSWAAPALPRTADKLIALRRLFRTQLAEGCHEDAKCTADGQVGNHERLAPSCE